MCAAGAGRPLPRFVQKAEGRGPGECGPFQDFTRTCSEKPCSPASARSSAKSLLPAARRRGGIAAPLPADRKNGMPCPCLCLPPSRRLRPPAASLLLRAALRKRRRLPNLSFQRRTNDARPNSLSRAQRNALRLLPFGDFSSQSGAVLRPGASLPEKRCPSCLPCPEKSLSTAAEAVFAADRLPSRFRQKAPHSAGKRPLRPASEFPAASVLTNAPGTEGLRSFRACTASACLPGFYIPAQFSHPDSASASRHSVLHPGAASPLLHSVPIPQHRSSAALRPSPTRRPRSDAPPLPSRCAPAPGTPSSGF